MPSAPVTADADPTPRRRRASHAEARLAIAANAVFVGKDDARARGLKAALAARGISSYLVAPDSKDMLGMLDRDRRVSVLGVRVGELGRSQQDEVLTRIYDHPGLTTFVVGANAKLERQLRELGVTQFHKLATKPAEIATCVVASLSGHYYDRDIANALGGVLSQTLESANLELTTLQPILRVGANVLGRVSAVTVIGGDGLSGRLVVSGPLIFFERLARNWLGRKPTTKEMLWDAAGELCNRATGLVRAHYAARGLDSRQATPTIIEGSDASIRGMTSNPGLVVPLEVARIAEPVHIELVLAWKADVKEPDPVPESMMAGELTFL